MDNALSLENLKTFFGGELKATGKGVVEGYLVRFGSPSDTDLENDFFTKSTDFGIEFNDNGSHKIGLYYNHGMDKTLKTKKIGYAEMKMDDMGIWLRGQLDMSDEYNKMIYDMAKQGKIGLSSGAASHMVEREKRGKAYEIKRWALAEASLTPTPAEFRNMVEAKTLKAKVEDLKVGDFVSWGTSASDAIGKIVDIKKDGEVNSSISDYTLTGTEEDPAYVIKLVQKDSDGNSVLTEQTVVHRADALRKTNDPIKSALKANKEDLSVGDYVQWMAYGTTVRGQIEKIKNDGPLTGYPLGTRMVGSKEKPVFKVRVYQKQNDGSYAMDSATTVHRAEALTKISKPKGKMMGKSIETKEYMEDMEEHEDVEEMVDGLTKADASPEDIAMSVFDGVQEDMFFDAIGCLADKLKDALVAISEYGKPEYADAVLEKFHSLALDYFNNNRVQKEMAEEGEETMPMKTSKPENIRDVEKLLRDAGISRSQSKHLANLVWSGQRDVESYQEPMQETKTIDDKAELRRALLEKAKLFKNI